MESSQGTGESPLASALGRAASYRGDGGIDGEDVLLVIDATLAGPSSLDLHLRTQLCGLLESAGLIAQILKFFGIMSCASGALNFRAPRKSAAIRPATAGTPKR